MSVTKIPSDDFTCARGDMDLDEKIQAGKTLFIITGATANLEANGQAWLWHVARESWIRMWPLDANKQLASGKVRLMKPRT